MPADDEDAQPTARASRRSNSWAAAALPSRLRLEFLRKVMDDAPGRSVDGWDHCLGALPRAAWTGSRYQSDSVCIRSSGVMNVEMSELGVHGSARRRVRSFSDHPWISGGSYVRSSQPQ